MVRTSIPGLSVLATVCLFAASDRSQHFPPPLNNPAISQIFDLVRDRHGLLWITSPEGIFRFDGSHYLSIAGPSFASGTQFLALDKQDRLWAAGKQGVAVRLDATHWKVVLQKEVTSLAASPNGLWVAANGIVHLIAESTLEPRAFPDAHSTGFLVVDLKGVVWFPCAPNICSIRSLQLSVQPNPAAGDWKKVIPAPDGTLWLGSRDEVVSLRNGRPGSRHQQFTGTYFSANSVDPLLMPDGNVVAIRAKPPFPANLSIRNIVGASCALPLNDADFWFCASTELARFRLVEPNWTSWHGNTFTAVAPDGFLLRPNATPLLLTSHGSYELTADEVAWKRLGQTVSIDINKLIEDGHHGYWLASRADGLMRTDPNLIITEHFPKLCGDLAQFRGMLRDTRGRTWIGGKNPNCFFEVTGQPGQWQFRPQRFPGPFSQTVAVHQDPAGRVWVGHQEGLAFLDDKTGVWQSIRTSAPVDLVREFTFDGNDVIWVSRRRNGPFLRLERHGEIWNVRAFSPKDYPPDDTFDIHVDKGGWLWRTSQRGLHAARPGHYAPSEWLFFSKRQGLASRTVDLGGFAEDDAGNIWTAGLAGVTRFKPSLDWFAAPAGVAPLVTRVSLAGGPTWLDPAQLPAELPHGAPAVDVDLSSMEAASFRPDPVRYRLQPLLKDWTNAKDDTVRLASLADGDYVFEAAYTGEGQPEVMRWAFRVGNPGFGLFTRAAGLGLLGIAGIAGWLRRDWLHYWFSKSVFLATTNPREEAAPVVPNNYVGRTLAHRFQILERVSRGGFAVTYKARDLTQGGEVIVKVLNRLPGQESFIRQRFAHGVAALHTLHHPGVVRLVDSFISPDGEPCLAMELLQGPTLREVEDQGPLTRSRAANLIEQLGAALDAIHRRGIVHRDLKPENVIVVDAGSPVERIVIIDFGTSASRGPEQNLEATSTLTGSVHYLAPERLTRQYSTASDVYSLGVMILEMLTARRPAEFEVAPMDPAFIQLAGKQTGVAVAAYLADALNHQPAKRPTDVAAWTLGVANLLRQSKPTSVVPPST